MKYISKGDHFGKVRADDINALYRVFDTIKGDGSVTVVRGGDDGRNWLIHGDGSMFPEIQSVADCDANEDDDNYDEDCSLDELSNSIERRVRIKIISGVGKTKQSEFRIRGFDSASGTISAASGLPESYHVLIRDMDGDVPVLKYVDAALVTSIVDSEAETPQTESVEHADESGHESELRLRLFSDTSKTGSNQISSGVHADILDLCDFDILCRSGVNSGETPTLKYERARKIIPTADGSHPGGSSGTGSMHGYSLEQGSKTWAPSSYSDQRYGEPFNIMSIYGWFSPRTIGTHSSSVDYSKMLLLVRDANDSHAPTMHYASIPYIVSGDSEKSGSTSKSMTHSDSASDWSRYMSLYDFTNPTPITITDSNKSQYLFLVRHVSGSTKTLKYAYAFPSGGSGGGGAGVSDTFKVITEVGYEPSTHYLFYKYRNFEFTDGLLTSVGNETRTDYHRAVEETV